MENSEILSLLGLMRKANALSVGAEDTAESCGLKKARIVLSSSDASASTLRWMRTITSEKDIPYIPLKIGKAELGGALGVGECAACAICDTGFAITLCKKIGLDALVEELEPKLARERRRKAKKLAGKARSNTSKRGK